MTTAFTESVVEDAALAWLAGLGYTVLHGPEIAVGEPSAERGDPNYRDVVLERRLRHALGHLNPDLPSEALEDAYRKLTRSDAPSLVERNRAVHRMLIEGIPGRNKRGRESFLAAVTTATCPSDTHAPPLCAVCPLALISRRGVG